MKNKILILGLSLFGQFAFAQVWVESSNYGDNSLDTSKWTQTVFNSGFSLDFASQDLRVVRDNNLPQLDAYSYFIWHRRLPLNSDWTILQRIKADPTIGQNSPNGAKFGAAFMAITDNNNYWLHHVEYQYRSEGNPINNAGFNTNGGSIIDSPQDFSLFTETLDYRWLGISFVAATREIKLQYSLDNSLVPPDVFSLTALSTTLLANNISEVGVETGIMLYSGAFNLGQFAVVPEPSSFFLLIGGGVVLMAGRRRG